MSAVHRYFIVHKPFNMVSQFVSPDEVNLLGGLDFPFPEGTHAIGRLDNHSEGLLLLTTDKRVTRLLFQSEVPHKRTYLVQVNNKVTNEELKQLNEGITIKIKGGENYITTPCEARIVEEPIQFKRNLNQYEQLITTTWLSITLTEGKFHQIRKMVAAIYHRCKRLIRISIEDLMLEDLPSGKVKEIDATTFFNKLKLKD